MRAALYLLASLIVAGFIVGLYLPGWALFPIGLGVGYGGRAVHSASRKALPRGR